MKYTVVLTGQYPPAAREILAGEYDVIEHPTELRRSEDDMILLLSEGDAAITLPSDPVTRRVLAANPNLRIVASYAVGTNNIDLDAARELGVTITKTPGGLTETTGSTMARAAATDVRRFLSGMEPLHRVV